MRVLPARTRLPASLITFSTPRGTENVGLNVSAKPEHSESGLEALGKLDPAEVREVLLCMGERMDVRYALESLERLLGCDDSRTVVFRQAAAELVPARFA